MASKKRAESSQKSSLIRQACLKKILVPAVLDILSFALFIALFLAAYGGFWYIADSYYLSALTLILFSSGILILFAIFHSLALSITKRFSYNIQLQKKISFSSFLKIQFLWLIPWILLILTIGLTATETFYPKAMSVILVLYAIFTFFLRISISPSIKQTQNNYIENITLSPALIKPILISAAGLWLFLFLVGKLFFVNQTLFFTTLVIGSSLFLSGFRLWCIITIKSASDNQQSEKNK